MVRTRWRKVLQAESVHQPYQVGSTGNTTYYNTVYPHSELQIMRDETNPAYLLGRTLEDIGGPLESVKIQLELDDWTPTLLVPNYQNRKAYCLVIPSFPSINGLSVDLTTAAQGFSDLRACASWASDKDVWGTEVVSGNPYALMENNTMDMHGATAISRCRPTIPAVDLATAVAELISEGRFFSLPGHGSTIPGEWLNYNLALLPAYSTFQDLRRAMEDQDALLAQYERDAGRLVRRRYEPDFWNTSNVTKHVQTNVSARSWEPENLAAIVYFGERGTQVVTTKTTEKMWFSGAFTYTLPEEGWRRTLLELDQAYGILPGIDTVWELVPYSFVVDYFANMGDVLGNLNSFMEDGLVMPYGYIMRSKKIVVDVEWTGPLSLGTRYVTKRIAGRLTIEVLQRRAATPFGFGFDWGGITARQTSILAALGISRVL